ncbi:molybdenum cofactor guanylyltransferase MobA, partial [Aeromonas allosaccharophila]
GGGKMDVGFARHNMAVVSFADQPDAFINRNSPAELAAYEARLLAPAIDPQQGVTS